jgi:hypothetical protein
MNFKRKRRRQARAYYWNAKQLYRTADRMKARRLGGATTASPSASSCFDRRRCGERSPTAATPC